MTAEMDILILLNECMEPTLNKQSSIERQMALKARIQETREKIIADLNYDIESFDEQTCCEVCYTNKIICKEREIQPQDLGTVELVCRHRFCSDCVMAQLKEKIENGEIDNIKCLDYTCLKPIDSENLKNILNMRGSHDLYEKYERFKN